MPGIIPGYDPESKQIRQLADDERKKRVKDIDQAWAWREGDHPKTLDEMDGAPDNVAENLTGQVIDDICDFIGEPEFMLDVDEGSELQALLDELIAVNDLYEMWADSLESGNVSGHAFLRLSIPDGVPVTENGLQFGDGLYPEISLVDARHCQVFWDVSRASRREPLWFRLSWKVGDSVLEQDIVPSLMLPDGDEMAGMNAWVIIERIDERGNGKFEEVSRDLWPFPFAPIIEWKNDRKPHSFYGQSTIGPAAQRLNHSINFFVSNTGRIIKHHAHPRSVLTGYSFPTDADGNSLVSESVGGLIEIPSSEAQITMLNAHGDIANSLAYVDRLERRFFAERRVLDQSSIKDRAGAMTNFGVRMLYINMLQLIAARRKAYGNGFSEALRRAMAMMGIEVRVWAKYSDPLPVNRTELVQAVSQEAALGITSRRTLASELGRDYMAEQEQINEEAQDAANGGADLIRLLAANGGF